MSSVKGPSRYWRRLTVALAVAVAVVGLVALPGCGHAPRPKAAANLVTVQVVQPRLDKDFKMTVSQPCFVAPYYRVNVESRVAGPVIYLKKDKGDPVEKGERLLEISLPDQVQEKAKKALVVRQREKELAVAKRMTRKAEEDVHIAEAAHEEKLADIDTAKALEDFRKSEYERYSELAKTKEAITPAMVDERLLYYRSAVATSRSARAAAARALAEKAGAVAKLDEAKADEEYKQALIDVANKDLAVATEQLGLATLHAEISGTITERNIDPGGFAQSSTTGQPRPLLAIERSDIVTVYAKFPDTYAPYIDTNTEVTIELRGELQGLELTGKVTRTSGSLDTPTHDRTLRVEMDVYNRPVAQYEHDLAEWKKTAGLDLKSGDWPAPPNMVVTRDISRSNKFRPLLPGGYGRMTVVLRQVDTAHLLPSQAIFIRGGKSYIYQIVKGKVVLVPVEVDVDDGVLTKVMVIDPDQKRPPRELTGEEQVVLGHQDELSERQEVRTGPAPADVWTSKQGTSGAVAETND
jgi:multidrug resistance efflux pump